MDILSKSFWTYVYTVGRVPKVPPGERIGNPEFPLGVKALSMVVTSPGNETVDPADIVAKTKANQLRRDSKILNMPSLQSFGLASDAMSIPNAAIIPAQQGIASLLGGNDGF